jgi:signal transduction histidine kinase
MVRTLSAWLRRSFAQLRTARQAMGAGLPSAPPLFIAVSLLQSTLLVGLTISVALDSSVLGGSVVELFSAVAIFSAFYIGYAVTMGGNRNDAFSEPTEWKSVALNAQRISDLEQLARLKARVSHELRTPLNAVIGFSDMMHREVLGPVGNERYREYAAHIRQSAEHFQSATEKTLAVTELLATPRGCVREQVSLNETIEATLSAARGAELDISIRAQHGLMIESNREALLDAMHHLGVALQGLARATDSSASPKCSITTSAPAAGYVDLCFRLQQQDINKFAHHSELTPGLELTLMLARLGIEAAGGVLIINTSQTDAWTATVRMTAAVN